MLRSTLAPLSLVVAAATLGASAPALSPFVLPWNEAPDGPASLAAWNPSPAGARGHVTVDAEGHFSIGGERIRFLGVNFTSGSNFPAPEFADAVAARLASFGVNSARFHHMDAPWNELPLLDYPGGGSRRLNPEGFARFYRLVQAMKAHGIYSDINLLVSRNYTAQDGFPAEIEEVGWKDQHILGFFLPHALELQKEYARALLTSPGPDGGAPLAGDPAVAFVELLNENGLFQKWYEGVLDELPEPFREPLHQKWIAWLREHYSGTPALRSAWGGRSAPAGAVLVAPGKAGAGGGWTVRLAPGATAEAPSFPQGDGHVVIRVKVAAVDVNAWEQASLAANGIPVKAGQLYTVSFNGRAERPTTLYLHFDSSGETGPVRLANLKISETWSRHEVAFVAPADGDAGFTLGGINVPGEYNFSDLQVREGGELRGVGSDSLELGTVPAVPGLARSGPTFTAEAQSDWLRFLRDLETVYWKTMYDFVKRDLGFRGVVFGTIISNSPAGVQAGLDSIDAHCYWTHPKFPAGDWSESHWIVEPKSMVVDPAGSTIVQLARQRVKGKPFTVTEYQHCSPNPYAAEAPLLAATYGALQDWDGVWLFEYTIPPAPGAVADYAGRISSFFDDSQHPTRLANYLLAAALFRRGDVAPAKQLQTVPLGQAREIELLRTRARAWAMPDASMAGLDGRWALRERIALDVSAGVRTYAPPALESPDGPHRSDTGEVLWDASAPDRASVRVTTARSRVAYGFIAGKPVELGDVTFRLEPTSHDWATAGLTLLEGELGGTKAARALLVVTAQVENTHQHWKTPAHASLGKDWGDAPTRIETVRGEVTLPLPARRVTVYALDEHGRRRAAVTVKDRDGRAVVSLGEDKAGATLWYEVEVAAE